MCLLTSVLFFIITGKTDAQSIEFGVRYMPTFSSFEIYTQDRGRVSGEFSYENGFGALLGVNITDHFGLQGEVIYWDLAQKYRENDVNREISLKYLNIPILMSLNTGKSLPVNLNLVVGPQLGINVGSSLHSSLGEDPNNAKAVLAVKKGDLGLAYGAGIDFGLGSTFRLGLGFRGVYGIVDISDDSETQITNSYYVLQRTHVKTYSGYIGLSVMF